MAYPEDRTQFPVNTSGKKSLTGKTLVNVSVEYFLSPEFSKI